MKKKYADILPLLKELFPDWSDEDLVFALEDTDGELEEAIERITEGSSSALSFWLSLVLLEGDNYFVPLPC